jgi:hypothetical protein
MTKQPLPGQNKPEPVAELSMTVGTFRNKPYPEVKTTGIKTRGNGAATKGTTARGPMA